MNNLLPPNATAQERAIAGATARLGTVPTPLRDVWSPDTCPAELLPWLAWSLSLDSWQPYWPDAVKRQRIRMAVDIARSKGTAKSVRDVVSSFGSELTLNEWWQTTPKRAPHTFEVLLRLGSGVPISAGYQLDIIDEVSRTKPVRSHFTFSIGVRATGTLRLTSIARCAVQKRMRLHEAPYAGGIGIYTALRPAVHLRIQATEA